MADTKYNNSAIFEKIVELLRGVVIDENDPQDSYLFMCNTKEDGTDVAVGGGELDLVALFVQASEAEGIKPIMHGAVGFMATQADPVKGAVITALLTDPVVQVTKSTVECNCAICTAKRKEESLKRQNIN